MVYAAGKEVLLYARYLSNTGKPGYHKLSQELMYLQ